MYITRLWIQTFCCVCSVCLWDRELDRDGYCILVEWTLIWTYWTTGYLLQALTSWPGGGVTQIWCGDCRCGPTLSQTPPSYQLQRITNSTIQRINQHTQIFHFDHNCFIIHFKNLTFHTVFVSIRAYLINYQQKWLQQNSDFW